MLRKMIVLLLGVILMGTGLTGQVSASTGFSLSMGTDDFYLSVGNYDYYPYTLPYYNRTPRVSFHNVMGDYGSWVSLSQFGQVWRPYVRSGWRPYVNGHWSYTRYGPTWVGYEPWAWAGYHYGNWIWSSQFGWVWIPGYDWHPGRVIWSQGNDTIGWMPAPPQGYDYSRGYLDYRGSNGQFDYYDDDFGNYDDDYYDDDYYGNNGYYNDHYNPGYNSNPFFGSGYRNIVVNLWVFIDVNQYRHHNYGDCYLDSDYTRAVFDRRSVRISSRPMERRTLERIVKQKVNEASVQLREIETDNRKLKVVIPSGEEENIRRNANRVVKNVIAPAFAEKRRNFKGLESENARVVDKVFKQENRQPRIKKQTVEEVLREVDRDQGQVERQRKNLIREKTDQVIRKSEAAKSRKKEQPESREKQFKPAPSKKQDFEVDSKQNQKNRDEQFDTKGPAKQKQPQFETRQAPKPKNQNSDFGSKQIQKNRDQQFDTKGSTKQNQREFETRQAPKPKSSDFDFGSQQNQKNRNQQFDTKGSTKQNQREFETRQAPKPKSSDFDFGSQQNQKNRNQQFDTKGSTKQNQRELETRQAPKPKSPAFDFGRTKEDDKSMQNTNRKPEKTYSEPRIHSDPNARQDEGFAGKKTTSRNAEEQVDQQKEEESKSKKSKKEDSKKKKQNEPDRQHR